MKILFELQGLQTQSRARGIGRYTRDLLRALARQWPDSHEFHVALSSPLDEALDEVIADLQSFLPQENIHLLRLLRGTAAEVGANAWRSHASAHIMRHAIDQLKPDVVWHSSVMEGRREDAVVPAEMPGSSTTVCTLYDLLPLHDPEGLLAGPGAPAWYAKRLDFLRKSERLFAISGWTKADAVVRLGLDAERIVNIGCGVDPAFQPRSSSEEERTQFEARYRLEKPFVLYSGGYDERKNVEALVVAFQMLPAAIRDQYALVLAGNVPDVSQQRWFRRLGAEAVRFPGHVSDEALVDLYRRCSLFVFPSTMEGFGLPPLEAMACGAPVICSNATSLPDVVGREDMLFAPDNPGQIAERMQAVLSDASLSESLRRHGLHRASLFSWDAVASRAIDALRDIESSRKTKRVDVAPPAPPGTRPKLRVRVLATEVPTWIEGLRAWYDVVAQGTPTLDETLPAAEHSGVRILYVADARHADRLAAKLERVPGIVVTTNGSNPQPTTASPDAQYLRYVASGYAPLASSSMDGPATATAVWDSVLHNNAELIFVPPGDAGGTPGDRAHQTAHDDADEANLAAYCRDFIEARYADCARLKEAGLIQRMAEFKARPSDDDLAQAAFAMLAARPPAPPVRWLVDVSSLARENLGTGVARVVTQILGHWLRTPPAGIRIEPVRFGAGQFRFAHRQALELAGLEEQGQWPVDDIVHARPGDAFIGLDWAPESLEAARPRLEEWRRGGVASHFIANDLLPVRLPHCFHPYSRQLFERWLRNTVWLADHIHCISGTTARDLQDWLDSNHPEYQFGRRPRVTQFHLGADLPKRARGVPVRSPLEAALHQRPTLLMVGTLEPRKGHLHALEAIDSLWQQGVDLNFVIVGHRGWMVDGLIERLERHPEHMQRLFWFDDMADAELAEVYARSTALLAVSEGEGYGLPLIEAAQAGLPIIARALPVFREVMGEVPFYLDQDPARWAMQLRQWLASPAERRPHDQWPSWSQAADALAAAILQHG